MPAPSRFRAGLAGWAIPVRPRRGIRGAARYALLSHRRGSRQVRAPAVAIFKGGTPVPPPTSMTESAGPFRVLPGASAIVMLLLAAVAATPALGAGSRDNPIDHVEFSGWDDHDVGELYGWYLYA